MSDDKTTSAPPAADAPASPTPVDKETSPAATDAAAPVTTEPEAAAASEPQPAASEQDSASAPAEETSAKESDKAAEETSEKPADRQSESADVEMTDAAEPAEAADAGGPEQPAAATATETPKGKAKQRKSLGSASASKKLNKKQSKARILHLDAQPGDHYFVKLKGFPQWPVIICDEDMLPQSLLKSRPVTAKRADGTYREDYADGAKKAADRTFPVMYLHTNEFGWVPNTDLIELDPSTVLQYKTDKMRKDLQAAHELAAESHPLSFYKEVLQQFQEDMLEKEKAKAEKAAAKAATPKGKKSKAVAEDEDVEMEDVGEDEAPAKEKKQKKRKAEENAETPARSDSVKKPKIKLTTNSTPKANGTTATPKSAKPASEAKTTKIKTKKAAKDTEEKKAEKEVATPKEPELSPEEKHARKEKEVLFLRHKLQKGLLTRDQEPKEEEMKVMSEFLLKLEGFPDLEVSIIRATKINKVLKAILKLDNIPKEEEFQFKTRSQSLLDKWNKLLAVDAPPATPAEATNGVNGSAAKPKETKTNGVKAKSESAAPEKVQDGAKEEPATKESEAKEEPAKEGAKTEEKAEAADEAVEASA